MFDPSTKSFDILHDRRPLGNTFPLLGITFDARLNIEIAVCALAAIGHARVTAMLRLRRIHTAPRLVGFYTAQVLRKIEFASPSVFHTTSFVLSCKNGFSKDLASRHKQHLLSLRLAPLRGHTRHRQAWPHSQSCDNQSAQSIRVHRAPGL